MNTKATLGAAIGIALLTTGAMAANKPIRLSADARIEVVAYSPYNVVPINGTTFTTTQITFGKDEYIENIQNGDLGAWTASVDKNLPYMLFLKPTAYGSQTNMTIVTSQHTYYFHLSSNAKGAKVAGTPTYALHFMYPEQQKAKVEKAILAREKQKQAEIYAFKNPADYNWDYSFHGDKRIVPTHVFDDGKFTYMQLQPGQPVPAVFAVTSPNGSEAVVNYRQDGQYLVVQRTAPQFTLRVGKTEVASIFNIKAVNALSGHHGFF